MAAARVSEPVAAVPNEGAPVSDVVVAPVSDVSRVGSGDAPTRLPVRPSRSRNCPPTFMSFLFGIAGVQPVLSEVAGINGPGPSAAAGASVASRLPLALPLTGYLGPATCRCLGPAGDRRGNRGCTARCDCARSSVSGVRDSAGQRPMPRFRSVRGRLSGMFSGDDPATPLRCGRWPLPLRQAPAGLLVSITLAGVRAGYRQATAGVALRNNLGTAHFRPSRGRSVSSA